jgi:hypothetical protein
MHRVRASIALMLALAAADTDACEHSLEGTWKSDAKKSMDYNGTKSNLPSNTTEFLSGLLGHLTMKFDHGVLDETAPDTELTIASKKYSFKGFNEHVPYSVLFCNSSTIVWKAKTAVDTEEEATTFNFVDADTAWVYLGSTNPKLPDIHGREYFTRSH